MSSAPIKEAQRTSGLPPREGTAMGPPAMTPALKPDTEAARAFVLDAPASQTVTNKFPLSSPIPDTLAHSVILHNSRKAQALQCPGWRKGQRRHGHTNSGILLSLKKEGNSDTFYRMDLEDCVRSETSQAQKDKCRVTPHRGCSERQEGDSEGRAEELKSQFSGYRAKSSRDHLNVSDPTKSVH